MLTVNFDQYHHAVMSLKAGSQRFLSVIVLSLPAIF
jgi:hypothetical protein